jgi:hypothetical protein
LEDQVSPPVERKLASLTERFFTTIHSAQKGLLVSMCVLVLSEILRQGEYFLAEVALEGFDFGVDVVVAFEGELGGEFLDALGEFTFKHLLFL